MKVLQARLQDAPGLLLCRSNYELILTSFQPDLGSLMQNPMMRQMAQSLMSNPDMMNNLMGSLGGAGRGGGGGGGGGMPDLSAMMNDPNIAEM